MDQKLKLQIDQIDEEITELSALKSEALNTDADADTDDDGETVFLDDSGGVLTLEEQERYDQAVGHGVIPVDDGGPMEKDARHQVPDVDIPATDPDAVPAVVEY